MARLVEYSDDEPTDVLKSPRKGTSSKAETAREPRKDNNVRDRSYEDDRENRRERLEALSASTRKPRRVLDRRAENPLLRPVGWIEKRGGEGVIATARGRREGTVEDPEETTATLRPRRERVGVQERKGDVSDEDADSGTEEASDESEGMSDFIVDDDESLEENEDEDERTPSPPPSPRSVRKLVRGRRPVHKEDEDLEVKMRTLDIRDRNTTKDHEGSLQDEARQSKDNKGKTEGLGKPPRSPRKSAGNKGVLSKVDPDIDQPTKPPIQRPSQYKDKSNEEVEDTRFTTPPSSPRTKPRGLPSPKKIQHIPTTPHRPSMDSFWRQDVINEWNDEYSPRKAPKTQTKSLIYQDQPVPNATLSPVKGNTNQAKIERDAKKAFLAKRDRLAQEFFLELDEKLAGGQISKLTKDSGGVKIIWNNKLMSTAGQAVLKRQRVPNMTPIVVRPFATIQLAEKVIDDEDRLLNTLAHEFCHLCTMLIDKVTNNPHGKVFKSWAARCTTLFGDRGVEVTTRHSYTIQYKYAWECEMCGVEYKRHSRSIDPQRQRCGKCKGKLLQTRPLPRLATPRKPGGYQDFVKENMAKVRKENPGSPQKEIMSLIGKKYQEFKKQGDAPVVNSDSDIVVDEEDASLEGIVENEDGSEESSFGVGMAVKKLDFIDLSDD